MTAMMTVATNFFSTLHSRQKSYFSFQKLEIKQKVTL